MKINIKVENAILYALCIADVFKFYQRDKYKSSTKIKQIVNAIVVDDIEFKTALTLVVLGFTMVFEFILIYVEKSNSFATEKPLSEDSGFELLGFGQLIHTAHSAALHRCSTSSSFLSLLVLLSVGDNSLGGEYGSSD